MCMLSAALRATGDVITPLCFLFFSSLLNVVFAYVLAFGLGPFPRLGVPGVALGGSFAGMIITIILDSNKKPIHQYLFIRYV